MRQIGMLAAAVHYALDNNIDRLALDHKNAKSLAEAAFAVTPSVVNPTEVETNIVVLDLSHLSISAPELNLALKAAGILSSVVGPQTLRLVTHLDVAESDVERVNSILPGLLQGALKAK
jgi:threonine aldolase